MDGVDLEQVKAFAQAVQRQLDLSMRWRLRPATVTQVDASAAVRVRLDGDSTPIRVVSMIGPVAVDERVMVLSTPPSGNHIVGWNGGRRAGPAAPAPLFGVSGTVPVTFASAASATVRVTFPRAFPRAPRVFVNIASTAPPAGWAARAVTPSSTGFNLLLTGPSAVAWSAVPVDWVAVVA